MRFAPRTRTVLADPLVSTGSLAEADLRGPAGILRGSLVYGEASFRGSSDVFRGSSDVDGLATRRGANVFIRQNQHDGSGAGSSSVDEDASSASTGTIVGVVILVCCLLGLAVTGLSLWSMKQKSPAQVDVANAPQLSEADESGGLASPNHNQRPPSTFNAMYQPIVTAGSEVVKLLDGNEPDPTYGELPDPAYSELSPAPPPFEAPAYPPIPTPASFPLSIPAPTADPFAGQHLVVARRPPHQGIIPDGPPPSFAESMRLMQMPPLAGEDSTA